MITICVYAVKSLWEVLTCLWHWHVCCLQVLAPKSRLATACLDSTPLTIYSPPSNFYRQLKTPRASDIDVISLKWLILYIPLDKTSLSTSYYIMTDECNIGTDHSTDLLESVSRSQFTTVSKPQRSQKGSCVKKKLFYGLTVTFQLMCHTNDQMLDLKAGNIILILIRIHVLFHELLSFLFCSLILLYFPPKEWRS